MPQKHIKMSSGVQIIKKKQLSHCKHLGPSHFFNIIKEILFVPFGHITTVFSIIILNFKIQREKIL